MRKIILSLVVCLSFMAVTAKSGWFGEAGLSQTKIGGMDMRTGILDMVGDGWVEGETLRIEDRYNMAPEFRLGYEFANTNRISVYFFTYQYDPTFWQANSSGDGIYSLHVLPYSSYYYEAVRAKNAFSLDILDLDYTAKIKETSSWIFEYLMGIRYTSMKNNFNIEYLNAGFAGNDMFITKTYSSKLIGPKVGINAKTKASDKLIFSAGADFTVLAGEIDVRNNQRSVDGGTDGAVFDTWLKNNFSIQQIVNIQASLGYNILENLMLKFGYKVGIWFNGVTTAEPVDGAGYAPYLEEKHNLLMQSFTLSVSLFL